HEVVGTCRTDDIPPLVRLDLRDHDNLRNLARQGFDIVLHSAGVVDIAAAEADTELAWEVNVRSVAVLLETLRGSPTRIIFVSSDNVFDGTRDWYVESDRACPINAYGGTKVAAEQLLAEANHLSVRIPIVYGRSPWSDRFLARFAARVTPAAVDLVCAPLYLPSLPAALERLWDLEGVVHLAGSEVVTRFELMAKVQAALDLPTTVVPVGNDETPAGAKRPKRLVLRSIRHDLAGPDLDTALAHLSRDSAAWS
ncbi:MAG: sugar nucleotide-binding protein, partial [Actinomycetota bacterium]|nr:sugar nucleotide-binding protein [Actinomycetota bacterium]